MLETVGDPAGVIPRRYQFSRTSSVVIMTQTRLFVGNLPYKTREQDLHAYFSQIGNVTSVTIMVDRETGKSRGFAFVEFETAEEANRAVEQLNNKEFQGRALTVNLARPKEERERSHRRGRRFEARF